MKHSCLASLSLAVISLPAYGAADAAAPGVAILYSIAGGLDGFEPSATVTLGSNGVLYGITFFGGTANNGTVFSLTPPVAGHSWKHAVLYNFTGGGDGGNPYGTMAISPGGVLYGTTEYGGAAEQGVAFSLSPPASPGDAWTESVLHHFTGGKTGGIPEMGLLRGGNGDLYGTTAFGGKYNNGVVFQLVPNASGEWTENVVHDFLASGDGAEPQAALGGVLLYRGGRLYGTTVYGGASGKGTIFSLVPPSSPGGAWRETLIYSFTGAGDGGNPSAGLTAGADGTLYGTTSTGADGGGTLFSLTQPATQGTAWTFTVLQSFSTSNIYPSTLLLIPDSGALYGTTNAGGSANDGTIFVLKPPSISGGDWTYSTLYTFTGANGATPIAGLIVGPNGALYGTTVIGGGANSGTIFRLTL